MGNGSIILCFYWTYNDIYIEDFSYVRQVCYLICNTSICDFIVRYVRVVKYHLLVLVAQFWSKYGRSIVEMLSKFHQKYVQDFKNNCSNYLNCDTNSFPNQKSRFYIHSHAW
jgi:hypothetical protein